MESKFFINDKETPWQELGGGVFRQMLGYNDQLMMVKVKFNEGAVGALHQHVHVQTTFCASGVFEFRVGEQTQLLEAGDAVYIPSCIFHGVVCLKEGVLIDTFNPARVDFL